MNTVYFKDLGSIRYSDAFSYQLELFNKNTSIKLSNRESGDDFQLQTIDHLLFCEHPHVITLGKSGDNSNLLLNENQLKNAGIEFYPTTRGGDITYHGPGQIVGYPIIDLEHYFNDVHKYMNYLEEMIILTLNEYDIHGGRIKGMTGVWLDYDKPHLARKICAMGVKISRWITMHGFALNVNTNLDYFNYIIPCGITGKAVTSIKKEMNKEIDIDDVKMKLKKNFGYLFDAELTDLL
jgi:lipoyl(octanoyl) transferase